MSSEKFKAEPREDRDKSELESIWKGKIFADGDPLDISGEVFKTIASELGTRSITPTSFISRRIKNDDLVRGELKVECQKIGQQVRQWISKKDVYVKLQSKSVLEMKCASSGLVKDTEYTKAEMDLSVLSTRFDTKIKSLQDYYLELDAYMAFLHENPDLYLILEDEYTNEKSTITRFGINAAHFTDEQSDELAKIYTRTEAPKGSVKSTGSKKSKSAKSQIEEVSHMLTPLEVVLIRKAMKHCEETNQNTALVDIFARDSSGSINKKANKLETHTIILHQQTNPKGEKEILIVDPSNSAFSEHIASNSERLFAGVASAKIVATKDLKIYSPADKGNVGPKADQYRDCIDIAAKLGLRLLEIGNWIDPRKLDSQEFVRDITNNMTLKNSSLFFSSDEAIARVRQSSKHSQEAYKWLDLLYKLITSAETFQKEALQEEINDASIDLFARFVNPDEYTTLLGELETLYLEKTVSFFEAIKSV